MSSVFGGEGGPGFANTVSTAAQTAGRNTGLAGLYNALAGHVGDGDYLRSLGQDVPSGVDLVGPSDTFTGGFGEGVLNGLMGALNQYASPGASYQGGEGLGQLVRFLQSINSGGGGGGANPFAQLFARGNSFRMAPGYQEATAPRGVISNLISGVTGGLLFSDPPRGGLA